jgi:hypothetical protein
MAEDGRHRYLRASLIAHAASGSGVHRGSRVEGGSADWMGSLAVRSMPAGIYFEARCVQAVTYLESRAAGTLGVDRQGGMGTRGYGSLPAA